MENNDCELLSRQVKQLYALAPVGIVASLINGPILIYIQWDVIFHALLLVWLVVLVVLNLLWMVLYGQFQKASRGSWNPGTWRALFIGGTLASGCLWGATGVIAFPEHSIPHQIFLAFVLGGMIAGATAVYAALQGAFFAYTLPTVTPLLVQFFVRNDELHLAMGGMGLLFVGLMCVTMRHNHNVMVASMNLSRDLGKANQLLQSEIHERQQAEVALRDSQEQLQSVVQSTDEGIISLNSQGEVMFWNKGAEHMFGYSQKEMQGRTLDRIIPDRFRQAHQAGIERATRAGKKTIDVELLDVTGLRRDGQEFPLEISLGYWHKNKEIFFMGIVRDVTARKETEMALRRRERELQQSQEELRALGTRLISAQEDERRRLSCELHDDMNQRLAVLALQIQSVQKTLTKADPMRAILQRLDEQVSSLSDDVRHLAHQLHPSILHELGLVVALKAFITDFARWEKPLAVEFYPEQVPHGLPKDIALCIFRVTQECLRNVAKHAQASRVFVRLSGVETGLELIIQDNGRGFNVEAVPPAQGLGLLGMKERVLAVQGTFEIQTSPGQGTTITVWIPRSPTAESSF